MDTITSHKTHNIHFQIKSSYYLLPWNLWHPSSSYSSYHYHSILISSPSSFYTPYKIQNTHSLNDSFHYSTSYYDIYIFHSIHYLHGIHTLSITLSTIMRLIYFITSILLLLLMISSFSISLMTIIILLLHLFSELLSGREPFLLFVLLLSVYFLFDVHQFSLQTFQFSLVLLFYEYRHK